MPIPEGPGRDGACRQPRLLVVAPAPIVSVILTLAKPLNRLRDAGAVSLRYAYAWTTRAEDVAWADVVLFCRPAEVDELRLMERARRAGRRVMVALDDDLLAVPPETGVGRYYGKPLRRWVMGAFLRHADLVQVYNARLATTVQGFGAPVRQFPQLFDGALVDGIRPATEAEGQLLVAYPTSRGAGDTLGKVFLDALSLVPDDIRGRLRLHVWGAAPAGFEGLPGLVVRPYQPDYDSFIRDLAATGYAMGLAPLVPDHFHACKTELKFREYGGCGIPGIFTDAPPYAPAVEDGRTGLLVPNRPEAWADAITRLARDSRLRWSIAEAARQEVARRYGLPTVLDAWSDLLSGLMSTPPRRDLPGFPLSHAPAWALERARGIVRWAKADRGWLAKLPTA